MVRERGAKQVSATQGRYPGIEATQGTLRQGCLRSLQQLSRCHLPPMLPSEFDCIHEGSLKLVTSIPSRRTNLVPVRSAKGVVISAEGLVRSAHGVFPSVEGVARSVEGVVLSAEGVVNCVDLSPNALPSSNISSPDCRIYSYTRLRCSENSL